MATRRVFPREIDGHWYKIEIYYDAEGRRRQRSLGGISEAEAQMLKANPPLPEPVEKHQEVQVEGKPDSELEITVRRRHSSASTRSSSVIVASPCH